MVEAVWWMPMHSGRCGARWPTITAGGDTVGGIVASYDIPRTDETERGVQHRGDGAVCEERGEAAGVSDVEQRGDDDVQPE